MSTHHILAAVIAIELCALGIVCAWRVYIRADLSWMDVATLLVALMVFPVTMTKVAFRRKRAKS